VATKALIVPAAGAGSRLKRETPKPFLELSGRTILEHTIRRFLSLQDLRQILVATSEEFLDRAHIILDEITPRHISFVCLIGGDERQHSIYNALKKVSNVDLVLVHDAVRPFVKLKHIQKCCSAALVAGGAVLGVPVKDTIKRIDDQMVIRETPSRKYLWQTQTPQIFQKELLVEAYEKASENNFLGTDDASLVEQLGADIRMVEGDRSNFKITYPLDLKLAQLLIEQGI